MAPVCVLEERAKKLPLQGKNIVGDILLLLLIIKLKENYCYRVLYSSYLHMK